MKPWNILVTGSSGLISSEAVEYFDRQGHSVVGMDNNMRRVFFGPPRDTLWNLERLKSPTRRFTHATHNIRDGLSTLPIQPGVYVWRIGIYDSRERVDDWECLPQMRVVTVPLTQTRDDVAGILNISSEFDVRRIE